MGDVIKLPSGNSIVIGPTEIISLDFMGPITHQGKKLYPLIIIDHLSQLGTAGITQNTFRSVVVNALETCCSERNVLPKEF